MGGVGEHDDAAHGGDAVDQPFEEAQEGEIREDQPVLGVADDPGDLLVEEPRVQRVADQPRAGDPVPAFEMPPGVPGERRHAVAGLQPLARQPLSEPERAGVDGGVVGLVQRAFHRARDDAALRVVLRGVVDDPVDAERPILHQALHRSFLFNRRILQERGACFEAARYRASHLSMRIVGGLQSSRVLILRCGPRAWPGGASKDAQRSRRC
jgi:hypothetical protein